MELHPLSQHAESHKVGGSDPLDIEKISAEDINLADLAEKEHHSLDGLGDDDHDHYWNNTRGDAKILTHKNDANAHHTPKVSGVVFNLGLAAVGTKLSQVLIPGTFAISLVKIYADTAPTGASLIVDINKNGTTIFTTQANRPEIAIGEHSDDSGTPNITALAAGDRLSVDIDQVGSTIAGGNDLLIAVVME